MKTTVFQIMLVLSGSALASDDCEKDLIVEMLCASALALIRGVTSR